MATLRWAILCRNLIPEPEIGGYTLNSVFDDFYAPAYPATFEDPFILLTKWTGEVGEEFELTIDLHRLGSEKPPISHPPIHITMPHRHYMMPANLQGLTIEKEGLLEFVIKVGDKPVYSFPVEAIINR